MRVFHSDRHLEHAPRAFINRGRMKPCPEVPERARILKAAAEVDGHDLADADHFGIEPVRRVHDPAYLTFLENAWQRWTEQPDFSDEVVPNVHPNRNMDIKPRGIIGLAGYYQADTACPIGPGTWAAALASTAVALSAAQSLADGGGAGYAYALCRPPGHHAFADMAGGFCYLNNTAVAAQYCRDQGAARVAVLDVDVHHGNGTQGIFYHRADVLTVSLHGDPSVYYPFYTGYEDEVGRGDGRGFNLNLPLPAGAGDDAYLLRLEQGHERIRSFKPDVLVVALGLDASEHDGHHPFLRVSTEGFARIGAAIARLKLPTVLVQEGGYVSDWLGTNVAAFLREFERAR